MVLGSFAVQFGDQLRSGSFAASGTFAALYITNVPVKSNSSVVAFERSVYQSAFRTNPDL